jgi:hypothetical protein
MHPKRLVLPGLLLLLIGAFFHRTILGDRFYAVDFYQTFVPLRAILAEAWSSGLPGWTGRLGNGAPVLANPAYGVFYPPNLLYLGRDPAASMTLLTVAHFAFGALGAWLLARRWGLSRASAWITAVAFALGGPAVSSTAYPNLSWPLAWLPWSLAAHDEAARGRKVAGIAAMAIVWFSMLAMGDPVVLGAAILASGLLAVREGFTGDGSQARWRPLLVPALAGVGALILASPLLLAIARYMPHSVRGAGFKSAGIVQWSLHPMLLAGTVLPNPYGDPSLHGPAAFWARALEQGRGQPLLAGLYVGALLVALVVLGALSRAPRRAVLLTWLGLLVLLALGKYGPFYPLAGERPGFDTLRYPMKWILPAMLPVALLAGLGVEAIPKAPRRALVVFLAALAVLAAVCVGSMAGLDRALAALSGQPGLQIDDFPLRLHARTTWLTAAARAAAPLALALLALRAGGRATLPAIAVLVSADLALANRHLAPTVPRGFYDVPPVAKAILEDRPAPGRVFVDDRAAEAYLVPPRLATEAARPHHDRLLAYVGAGLGLRLAYNPDTEAYSPTAYARANMFVRAAPWREKLMLLGAAGVSHVVTFQSPAGPLADPIATVPSGFNRPLYVYRNPFPAARARVVPRLTPYEGDEGFIRAVQSAPDDFFRDTALVERADLPAGTEGDPANEAGRAEVAAEDARSITIDVDGGGGFLVLSDTLAPGWSASIDGAASPLIRVDLAFRAVPVRPGRHRVVMRYDPW